MFILFYIKMTSGKPSQFSLTEEFKDDDMGRITNLPSVQEKQSEIYVSAEKTLVMLGQIQIVKYVLILNNLDTLQKWF